MKNINSIIVDEIIVEAYNIGIIDDSKFYRGAIKNTLPNNKFSIVVEEANDEEAIIKFKSLSEKREPKLVIVGSSEEFINSYNTVEWLSKNYYDIKIVYISDVTDPEKLLSILKLGVNSILSWKENDAADIVSEIIKVSTGERNFIFNDSIIKIMLETLSTKKNKVDKTIFTEVISERDREIIKMIVEEKKGIEIATELFISPRTVENIINNLFAKFEVKSRVGLVVKAQKMGILE